MTGGPRLRVVLVAAVLLAAVARLSAAATSRTVTFRTEDGLTLAATWYEAAHHPAPAVILLHMQTRSRDDWQAVGSRLADAGIHALAVDFRGHGASASDPAGADADTNATRLALDVNAARAFVAARHDLVRAGAIGVAGASVGANVALSAAAADPAIASIALLSPGLNYRGVYAEAALRKYGPRPALLVGGTNDAYVMRSVKALATQGTGTREVRTLDNAGHGTAMLAHDPDLVRALVDWFQRTLL